MHRMRSWFEYLDLLNAYLLPDSFPGRSSLMEETVDTESPHLFMSMSTLMRVNATLKHSTMRYIYLRIHDHLKGLL